MGDEYGGSSCLRHWGLRRQREGWEAEWKRNGKRRLIWASWTARLSLYLKGITFISPILPSMRFPASSSLDFSPFPHAMNFLSNYSHNCTLPAKPQKPRLTHTLYISSNYLCGPTVLKCCTRAEVELDVLHYAYVRTTSSHCAFEPWTQTRLWLNKITPSCYGTWIVEFELEHEYVRLQWNS